MKNKKIILPLIAVLILALLIFMFYFNNNKIELTNTGKGKSPVAEKTDSAELFFPDTKNNQCLVCHKGIEPIRDPKSEMMQEIYKVALKAGYSDNECIVCHGGNPNAKDKLSSHQGSIDYLIKNNGATEFYPNPASVWINDKTCGLCHAELVTTQFTSLMFTEAGKIQGTAWGFGGLQGYNHDVATLQHRK